MEQANQSDVYDASGRGDSDTSGRGSSFIKPIATPETAAFNQQTLRAALAAVLGLGGEQSDQEVQEDADADTDDQVDYLASLFDGENLSEEFKSKTQVIFEAAIYEKVSLMESHMLEASKEIIEEQVTAHTENIIEQVDQYMNYVITEWMEENKIAVERGLRTEIAENFITGLKELFENSFIDVPQEKYNVLDDLFTANDDLKNNLNTVIRENVALRNEVSARLCAEAFLEEATGLADTQVEKLATLSEGLEFDNVEQYRSKVALLKESYFNVRSSSQRQDSSMLTEDMDSTQVLTETGNGQQDSVIDSVVSAISMLNRNSPKTEKLYNTPQSARLAGLISRPNNIEKFI